MTTVFTLYLCMHQTVAKLVVNGGESKVNFSSTYDRDFFELLRAIFGNLNLPWSYLRLLQGLVRLVATMHGGKSVDKVDFNLTWRLSKVVRVDDGRFRRYNSEIGLKSVLQKWGWPITTMHADGKVRGGEIHFGCGWWRVRGWLGQKLSCLDGVDKVSS